jgi:hypothetical protein
MPLSSSSDVILQSSSVILKVSGYFERLSLVLVLLSVIALSRTVEILGFKICAAHSTKETHTHFFFFWQEKDMFLMGVRWSLLACAMLMFVSM